MKKDVNNSSFVCLNETLLGSCQYKIDVVLGFFGFFFSLVPSDLDNTIIGIGLFFLEKHICTFFKILAHCVTPECATGKNFSSGVS